MATALATTATAAARRHRRRPAKKQAPGKGLTASRLSQSAYLTGAAEVDQDGDDAGDPDAKGSATFLQADANTICYGFTVKSTDAPTVVHIHRGAAGQNGPPVITFANVPKNQAGAPSGNPGASAGCKVLTDPAEQAALRRIRKNPANYYVNVHTAAFPNGALRGQMAPVYYAN